MEKRGQYLGAIICLVLATFGLTHLASFEPSSKGSGQPSPFDFSSIPYSIQGWTGRDLTVDEHAFYYPQPRCGSMACARI